MARVPLRVRVPDKNIWVVYIAIFILGLAYGISLALVSLYLKGQGFTKDDIGSLAVWFAMGIVALSLPMGAFVKRFSARYTLIASLFGYALAVTAFPFMQSFTSIALVRAADGAFSVGIWVCCETILLSRANKENKAFITSIYAMAMASGYVIGPFIATGIVRFAPMKFAFITSGVIALLSAIFVALRLDADVAEIHDDGPDSQADRAIAPDAEGGAYRAPLVAVKAPPKSALHLLWRIKTSCLATFSYGYFQASAVLFLPLYLSEQKGIAQEQTILVNAFFAAGMLLFTNIAGRIGDRRGHLGLMRILAIVGTTMIFGFIYLDSFAAMCVAVFIAGAALASISPLSLALQGVVAKPSEYNRANALYNVFYALGMLFGPKISGRIFERMGGIPMIFQFAILWIVFIVFTTIFRKDDPRARPAPSAPPAPPAPSAPG